MELSDYIRILRQRGWLIIVLGVLTAGAAFGFSKVQDPVYQSTVQILIISRPDFGQTQAAKGLTRDYAAWLYSSRRAARVIEALDIDQVPESLLGDVAIAAATDGSIITIEVERGNAEVANDIARVWAEQLVQWRNQENAGLREEDRIKAELIDDPRWSLESPKTNINTLAGGVFGALLGIMLIFVLEWIASGTLRRPEDVERYLDAPLIGQIPNG